MEAALIQNAVQPKKSGCEKNISFFPEKASDKTFLALAIQLLVEKCLGLVAQSVERHSKGPGLLQFN